MRGVSDDDVFKSRNPVRPPDGAIPDRLGRTAQPLVRHDPGARREARHMRLTPLTNSGCGSHACPEVYVSDRGTIVVQGALVAEAGVPTAAGEVLVEIPRELFHAAAAAAAAEPA